MIKRQSFHFPNNLVHNLFKRQKKQQQQNMQLSCTWIFSHVFSRVYLVAVPVQDGACPLHAKVSSLITTDLLVWNLHSSFKYYSGISLRIIDSNSEIAI